MGLVGIAGDLMGAIVRTLRCWLRYRSCRPVLLVQDLISKASLLQQRSRGTTIQGVSTGKMLIAPNLPPAPARAAGHRRRAGLLLTRPSSDRGGHRRHRAVARLPAPPTAHPRRPRLAHGMEGRAGVGDDTGGVGGGEAGGGCCSRRKWYYAQRRESRLR